MLTKCLIATLLAVLLARGLTFRPYYRRPVSYTHLDVYKRQAACIAALQTQVNYALQKIKTF